MECVACTEKQDVIDRVRETMHLPLLSAEPPEEPLRAGLNVEELLAKLKGEAGMEGMDFQVRYRAGSRC